MEEPIAMSRLWTNPPLKPDGTLDYARLTVREIGEDLEESLMDRIVNSNLADLDPFLGDWDLDSLPASAPPAALVEAMEELLRLEDEDADFRSAAAHASLARAARELRTLASKTA